VIPFLHLGPLEIPTFGLLLAVAMLAAYFVLRADLARRAIAPKSSTLAESLVAFPCLAGIVGAKLYHVLESPREFLADPWHQLFSQFGFAWFGGFLAGLLVYVWIAQRQNVSLLTMFDAGSPAAALGYGIGRIGCLLSGDGDYGITTSLPWGMRFPNGLVPTTTRVHPTPIYELIASCAIAWFLWSLGRRSLVSGSDKETPRVKPPSAGTTFAAYLILSGLARFLVEFIRINPRSFFGLTNAQAASLASIAVGALILWRLRPHSLKPFRQPNPQ